MDDNNSSLIPSMDGMPAANVPARYLGAILIDSGKLTHEEAERVLAVQREKGLRFGEAAMDLGFVRQTDLEYALARQFDYPYLLPGESDISPEIVSAYQPFSPQVEAVRALRMQLSQRWFDAEQGGGRALAVVSPGHGEGRSYISANLAVAYAQLGERTLLMDANMRNPRQHELFGLDNRNGLSAILAGRGVQESIQQVPSFPNLQVITGGALPPNPQELLLRPFFLTFLDALSKNFRVIIIDTPAGEKYADGQAIARAAGGALMVIRKNLSRVKSVNSYVSRLTGAKVSVVGSLMNDF